MTGHLACAADHALLKSIRVPESSLASVAGAVNIYLWTTLTAFFPERRFALRDDLLSAYAGEVLSLPNVTPNGLVLPKEPNQLAYNLVHRRMAELLEVLGLAAHLKAIQFPLNVRLARGAADARADARPRASTKPHSDIWAGDPAGAVVFMLPVLGDIARVGVDFFEPEEMPAEFLRPLADYDEGRPVFARARRYDSGFQPGEMILFDPYLLHRTLRPGDGLRISVDFRCLPSRALPSDGPMPDGALRTLLPTADWLDYGRGRLLVTAEPLKEFTGVDRPTVGYEVTLGTVKIPDRTDH
jgi:hypothetical protein